ncbi:glycosyl hydrolase family 18 protein [Cysteiniphilum halobium]|uniref:glycosyl hydrolase family 18 protein n=1 Tax=Cysteiniphilum halobium TaxID=2219059 RepID=UPI0013C307D0|nr:glycosyl hydrolase family 18 protein [Cysteiniphilum halobium]
MKNKKTLSKVIIASIMSAGLSGVAHSAHFAYPENIASYQTGDTVTNNGKTYECIGGAWCTQSHNEPGVAGLEHWWQSAWQETDTPSPDPEPTPDPDPTPDPQPDPTPTPEQCIGDIPNNPQAYKGSDSGYWSGYSKGDFVLHEDQIWQVASNTWWTNDVPGTSSAWQICDGHIVADLKVTISGDTHGIADDHQIALMIDDKLHMIPLSGTTIGLSKGEHSFTVNDIIDFEDGHIYVAQLSTPSVDAKDKEHYTLDISFDVQEIPYSTFNIDVNFNGAAPAAYPKASIVGTNGNQYQSDAQYLQAGNNAFKVPSIGSYQIKAAGFTISGLKYSATPVTIIDGAIQGDAKLEYQAKADEPLMVGYLTPWNTQVKISDAVERGYNTIVLAFAVVNGANPVTMTDPWNIYADWQNEGAWQDNMQKDIEQAKQSGKLKHVILSVGGEHNTFKPNGTDPKLVAQNIVEYAKSIGADGIDFDLENLGGIDEKKMEADIYATIQAIKQIDPDFVITAAPQFNLINNGEVHLVNTGTQRIYEKSVAAGMFDYIFIQEYNTGHYCIDQFGVGSICNGASETNINQMHPQFVVNSFVRLKQIIPQSTKIVPGQPSDKTAAGLATVYNGFYEKRAYSELCKAYQTPSVFNDPQFGGAMSWSINQDAANGYKFVNAIFADNCDSVQN